MKVNNENYFSPVIMMEYMSTSQFKQMEECQAKAIAELNGEIKTDKECFKEGHYFEACLCGNESLFIAQNPGIISSQGATKGQVKANYKKIEKSTQAFKSQKVFMDIIARCQQQVVVTGVINGVKYKGCIDFYDPETGNGYDTKALKDFKNVYSEVEGCRLSWYLAYGYHYQMAIYRELIKQTFQKDGKQHLMAVTKEDEPDFAFLMFDGEILDNALEIVAEFSPKFDQVKKGIVEPARCEKCAYCKQTKVVTEPKIILTYGGNDYETDEIED